MKSHTFFKEEIMKKIVKIWWHVLKIPCINFKQILLKSILDKGDPCLFK